MPLKDQLTEDMKNAMRQRATVKLSTIRFLLAEIRNVEIDNGPQDDAGIQKIIARQAKQIREAMAEFAKGGREDLLPEEEEKVAVLESYLPTQMDDATLQGIVAEALAGQDNPSMGDAMKAAMAKVQGQADGQRVSAAVRQALGL